MIGPGAGGTGGIRRLRAGLITFSYATTLTSDYLYDINYPLNVTFFINITITIGLT